MPAVSVKRLGKRNADRFVRISISARTPEEVFLAANLFRTLHRREKFKIYHRYDDDLNAAPNFVGFSFFVFMQLV